MSRIGDALKRAAAQAEAVEGRVDLPMERPSAGVLEDSDLRIYAKEPTGPAKAPVTRHQSETTASDTGRVLAGQPAEWNRSLVGAQEIPEVAVEQYRRLAGSLHDLQLQRGIKTLMVSSALPREGKTLTITNLALTLSQSYGRRVLLIDADLRHPSIHEAFGLRNVAGLADVVRSGGRVTPIIELSERLSVLTAGHPDSNPLAQLSSPHVGDFLRAAAQQFDWVLVDTPPIGLISDAQTVARICEAALFVVAAGSTPYALVQRGIAELGEDRIAGIVLNRMRQKDLPNGEHYGPYYSSGLNARL